MVDGDAQSWSLSTLTAKTAEPFSALVQEARLTVPKIPQFAEQATTSLMQLCQAHGLSLVGPPTFVYTGAGTGANDLLTLQVAFPVDRSALGDRPPALPPDTAVLAFAAFKCAAIDFRGPIMHLPQAYAPAMNELREQGHTPVEQSREVYKHWVGYDEPDNVVEIQLGVR